MTIACVEELADEFGDDFTGLIYCAPGLADQWRNSISRFTGGKEVRQDHWEGGSSVTVIAGKDPTKRAALYQQVYNDPPRYTIIGWRQITDDYEWVDKLVGNAMFQAGDEVAIIKSPRAEISKATKTLDTPFVYGITATPMKNGKPDELFSIMEWVDDTVLGRADLFDETFVIRHPKNHYVVGYQNLPLLHRMMRDSCVSRDDDDPEIAKYMPKMDPPERIEVRLDKAGRVLYQEIAADLLEELANAARTKTNFNVLALYRGDADAGEMQGRIMARISCLRMLCNHPQLLVQSGKDYLAEQAVYEADKESYPHVTKKFKTATGNWVTTRFPKPFPGSAYAAELLEDGLLDDLKRAPKLDRVMDDIDDVLDADDGDNKVIVFCTNKLVLELIEQEYGPALCARYQGGMTKRNKDISRDRFNNDPACRLFLSSDAGGEGLDLPAANYLFNVDVPYSAGNRDQRNGRHKRASSLWERVHVRDYLIAGSVEVYYADITGEKQAVAAAVKRGRSVRGGRISLTARGLYDWFANNQV